MTDRRAWRQTFSRMVCQTATTSLTKVGFMIILFIHLFIACDFYDQPCLLFAYIYGSIVFVILCYFTHLFLFFMFLLFPPQSLSLPNLFTWCINIDLAFSRFIYFFLLIFLLYCISSLPLKKSITPSPIYLTLRLSFFSYILSINKILSLHFFPPNALLWTSLRWPFRTSSSFSIPLCSLAFLTYLPLPCSPLPYP